MKQPHTVYLKDYLPPAFLVDTVYLRFELGEDQTRVNAVMSLRRNPDRQEADLPLVLNGEGLALESVAVDGRLLAQDECRLEQGDLIIPNLPDKLKLETWVRIKPQENFSFQGLYKPRATFFTQCEAEGFRRITFYPDRPDVMARFTTTIVADKARYPVLLSNGNRVDGGDLEGGRHWVKWVDPHPKPCYLFALVAGALGRIEDEFVTQSGKRARLEIYAEEKDLPKCRYAMESLQRAMKWDQERFGLELDLDCYMIVAAPDFNSGAMENKGLNIFNTKYVFADPKTATDTDFLNVESVIAHEYFHNWTGNRVTCRDWFQLSLKEGLTVYRDQEFSSDMGARAVRRIGEVRVLRAAQFPEDAGPMAHPVRPDNYMEIRNFYTATVYNKGAEVIRMMATLLGREGFRKGMDLYFQRHDGQAVTCDDFACALADANGRDFTQLKLWYSQAGTPHLEVTGQHDATAGTFALTVRQTVPPTPGQPEKLPMVIPLALGLLSPDGREMPLQLQGEAAPAGLSRVLEVTGAEQRFVFVNVAEVPTPSLLRDFSAPAKLDYPYADADLLRLMAHDSDPFNRWEAAQRLGLKALLALTADVRAGRSLACPAGYAQAFGQTLADLELDPALAALMLELPSEAYVAEEMAVADPDAIHAARVFLRRELARSCFDALDAAYRRLADAAPYVYTPEQAGRRALKSLCLSYLLELHEVALFDLALEQFSRADNMTDKLGALAALCQHDCAQRPLALDKFYTRFRDEALVVDKWLSLQASSRLPDTLARVKELLKHPAFDIKNPNKIYSLIGAFANANPVHFHAQDGSGYRFLAARVQEIDARNPEVAARMAKAFSRWRKMDGERQAQARLALQGLLDGKLSPALYEVVKKTLEG